jgi:amidase
MSNQAPDLHCFVPTTTELKATNTGDLAGVRVAVKDLFGVSGHTNSFGHPRWRDTHSATEATCDVVAQLLYAGANVVGLTKMDQLAYSLIGNVGEGEPPVNRFDPDCFCGGSSSGSASAVAGGLADLGLGTDTAGSIRVPAAACGLFGIRTTHGLASRSGVIPLARSLDVIGFLARSPSLLSRAIAATSGDGDEHPAIRRILLPADLRSKCTPVTWSMLQALAESLAVACEATVHDAMVDDFVDADVGDLFARIQGREIWNEHASWISANLSYLAGDVQTRLRRCEALCADPRDVIDRDLAARDGYRSRVHQLLGDDAILVMPVVPERGPLRASSDDQLLAFRVECFRLTAPSSLAGVPQVVLPTKSAAGYVPLSIIAGPGSDRMLIELVGEIAKNQAFVRLSN